jgi:hypothetical protein
MFRMIHKNLKKKAVSILTLSFELHMNNYNEKRYFVSHCYIPYIEYIS